MNQLDNSLYPLIFKRKSTRAFTGDSVPSETLEKLDDFILHSSPLLQSQEVAFDIQTHKKSSLKIAAYAQNDPLSFVNLAFMLQQMDLFLQQNGFGAYWNATVRATEKQFNGLPYAVCIIFGTPKDTPTRNDLSQFKRKQIDEITNDPSLPLASAVRLAPSARNKQPWFLYCTKNSIDFYCHNGGSISGAFENAFYKNLHWFDIGIAVCHATLALQQEGISPNAVVKSENEIEKLDDYTYGISLELT